jgi:hypothetical protein
VLESAARLQEVVPDAVLVGGSDQRGPGPEGVATQLARQLADPRPADARTIQQLGQYKGLDARWTDWANVTRICRSVAVEMVQ